MAATLRYQLSAERSFLEGEKVIITFRILNLSEAPVRLLNWYTPLEGIKGKILRVTCNGEPLEYRGRMVKRGQPEAQDYTLLKAGESAEAEFDLAKSYELRVCERYEVMFTGHIHDIGSATDTLPRPSGEFVPLEIPGNTVSFSIIPASL
jgi:peptidyl-Lys metalloendopeptidase